MGPGTLLGSVVEGAAATATRVGTVRIGEPVTRAMLMLMKARKGMRRDMKEEKKGDILAIVDDVGFWLIILIVGAVVIEQRALEVE